MKTILHFLTQISENNNKSWFDAHKSEYLAATATFNAFVEKLIDGIAAFDPSIKGLTVKDCTYRFHRDTRFSPNKMPYKTHFGAYICPNGKKSGYAGYYFHIEPKENGFIGGNILATGLYGPEPNILKSIREEIFLNGHTFEETVRKAQSFVLEDDQALKRVPRGYPADFKYAEYLKIKNPSLYKSFDNTLLLSDDLLDKTLAAYRETVSFNTWLNKAVEYAYEK
ncbi:MAG: DUF2461 domain-containing protein [Bacteroidales bacterium]|nr:DUF2461 domain-containing protein [Bacteroidales bacterium]